MWLKICPSCGNPQHYRLKKNYNKAVRLNRMCRRCMYKSDDYREKHRKNTVAMWSDPIKRSLIVERLNCATESWRKSAIPTLTSDAYKKKQRVIQKQILEENPQKIEDNRLAIKKLWENKNSVYHTENYRKTLSKSVKEALHTPEIRKRHIESLHQSDWLKVKTDKGQIELLKKWNMLGFRFEPNYQVHTDTDLFYVDGYDKQRNVVLEYDGKYHKRSQQKKKDMIRQNKIIDILKPKKFWRYDAIGKQFRNVLERNG